MGDTEMGDDVFEALLKAAVIERGYAELEQYPPKEEIDRSYRDTGDSAIRKLIKRFGKRKTIYRVLLRASKAAAVFLIITGIGFVILLQVDEVRVACVDFVKKTFSQYIRYDIAYDSDMEGKGFKAGYIPDGYVLTDTYRDTFTYWVTYENEEGNPLDMRCLLAGKISMQIDNEGFIIRDFMIGNNRCQSFIAAKDTGKSKFNKLTMHTEQGLIIVTGFLTEEEMIKIAENLVLISGKFPGD